MGVAYDSITHSHSGTSVSTSASSFSWSHTPVGTPSGIVVAVYTLAAAADLVTSVTYGGVTMEFMDDGTAGYAADTASEPGSVKVYFLGSSIPTGTQTVVVNRTNNSTQMVADSVSLTASTDTGYTDVRIFENDAVLNELNVDDGSPGTDSQRLYFLYSGVASPRAAGSNSTIAGDVDYGSYYTALYYETTPGQGNRPVGASWGSVDDRAIVICAIIESGGGGGGDPVFTPIVMVY